MIVTAWKMLYTKWFKSGSVSSLVLGIRICMKYIHICDTGTMCAFHTTIAVAHCTNSSSLCCFYNNMTNIYYSYQLWMFFRYISLKIYLSKVQNIKSVGFFFALPRFFADSELQNWKCSIASQSVHHRRRIELEDKEKVVASD